MLYNIRKKISDYISKRKFLASVLTLMTGTTIAQAIPIITTPVLAHIFTPEDFGIFALYMSLVSMLSIISTGRYELAVMLPEKEQDAVNVVALAVAIAFAISLAALGLILIFNLQIVALLGNQDIAGWLYYIPLSIVLTGMYQTINYWLNRKNQYTTLATATIYQSIVTAVANLALGFSGMGVGSLVAGNLLGQVSALVVVMRQVWLHDKDKIIHVCPMKICYNAKKYKDFPMINSLHAFIDIFQSSSVVFLLSFFFGNVVVGFHSFAIRILRAPFGFIGGSVGQVFYQQASATYNQGGDLNRLVRKTIVKLSWIAMPIFLVIIVFAPEIFSMFFGQQWREAGRYAQILSPWIFLNFIVSPLSYLPIILHKQRSVFYISLLGNSLILLAILYGGYVQHEVNAAFYALSILQIIYLGYVIFWIDKISKHKKELG